MDYNLSICCCVVIHLLYLYFPLVVCLKDAFNEHRGALSKRYLCNYKGLLVKFGYFGPHLNRSATQAAVVFAAVYESACRKIGIKFKLFPFVVGNCSIYNLVEVVRKNF